MAGPRAARGQRPAPAERSGVETRAPGRRRVRQRCHRVVGEEARDAPRAERVAHPRAVVVGERTVVLDRVGLETVRRAPRVERLHPGLGAPGKVRNRHGRRARRARRATRVERVLAARTEHVRVR